jgi:hypothetical protein
MWRQRPREARWERGLPDTAAVAPPASSGPREKCLSAAGSSRSRRIPGARGTDCTTSGSLPKQHTTGPTDRIGVNTRPVRPDRPAFRSGTRFVGDRSEDPECAERGGGSPASRQPAVPSSCDRRPFTSATVTSPNAAATVELMPRSWPQSHARPAGRTNCGDCQTIVPSTVPESSHPVRWRRARRGRGRACSSSR